MLYSTRNGSVFLLQCSIHIFANAAYKNVCSAPNAKSNWLNWSVNYCRYSILGMLNKLIWTQFPSMLYAWVQSSTWVLTRRYGWATHRLPLATCANSPFISTETSAINPWNLLTPLTLNSPPSTHTGVSMCHCAPLFWKLINPCTKSIRAACTFPPCDGATCRVLIEWIIRIWTHICGRETLVWMHVTMTTDILYAGMGCPPQGTRTWCLVTGRGTRCPTGMSSRYECLSGFSCLIPHNEIFVFNQSSQTSVL